MTLPPKSAPIIRTVLYCTTYRFVATPRINRMKIWHIPSGVWATNTEYLTCLLRSNSIVQWCRALVEMGIICMALDILIWNLR